MDRGDPLTIPTLEDRLQALASDPATLAAAAKARKDQVARIVARVAEGHEELDPFQVSWAAREARERLEHDDIYGQVMSQPISDIVADICHDLGLNPDWARLADEAWAQDEMDSGHVGEPLQALLDEDDEDERVLPCERQRTGGESDREGDRSNAQRAGGGIQPPQRLDSAEVIRSA